MSFDCRGGGESRSKGKKRKGKREGKKKKGDIDTAEQQNRDMVTYQNEVVQND